MRTLKLDVLNANVSPDMIRNSIKTVEFNHSANRGNPSAEYYLVAVIEISSIKNTTCRLQFFDSLTGFYDENKQFDLSFLPRSVINDAKKMPYRYLHVVLKKKLTYTRKQENRLLIPIGARLGCASNSPTINSAGLRMLSAFMENFYTSPEEFWGTLPLPRYKILQRFGGLFPSPLLAALARKFSSLSMFGHYQKTA
jgi:hypothetical protein